METEDAKVVEETKLVNFREIPTEDIEGNTYPLDLSKILGNHIFNSSKDVEENELGRNIYLKGEVEIKKSDVEILNKYIKDLNYVPRTAVEKAIAF